ncbi:MAG: LptA/OstA family protein [Desulfonatronovibrionaceae bacterium]
MKIFRLGALVVLLLTLCAAVQAEQDRVPTRITSEDMTYSGKAREVVFEKDVHAVRRDFELWSDRLIVHLSEAPQGNGTGEGRLPGGEDAEVERIVALDNVRVKSGERRGNCTKLVYETATEIITMTGDPVLIQKENTISGDKIVINVREDTSEVFSGGEKRVQAVFYSDPDEEVDR